MMQWLKALTRWILRFIALRPSTLRVKRVDELPDTFVKGMVYIAGEHEHLWFVAMKCPCGCGEVLQMNLNKRMRPCWRIIEHRDGTVTLRPSVHRTVRCASHFFVDHGRITWCRSEG